MSEDHTHDTKHVEGEYSDDGYDKTLLAYASNEDQDLDKEEDEEEVEETEEEVRMRRGNIKDSKKILIPYFLQIDTEVIDCPYLLSCHFLSTVLLHYHFADFLSTDQIQEAAIKFIKTAEYKNTCYDDVDALKY